MSTLVLKSFPEPLHRQLRAMAKEHRRSVTQEAIGLLEVAAGASRSEAIGTHKVAAPKGGGIRTQAEIDEFRRYLDRIKGSSTVKMSTDEILALTRG